MINRVLTPAGAWIDADKATDDDLRYSARMQINEWRDAQRAAGFEAFGRRWDSDPEARENLTIVVMVGMGSPTGLWTTADDQDVAATPEMLNGMYAAMVVRGGEIHARSRAMKALLPAMTREQLLAFAPGW